jgi:hypothetical protein
LESIPGLLKRLQIGALDSIPVSSDTVESEGRQMKQGCLKNEHKKIQKYPPVVVETNVPKELSKKNREQSFQQGYVTLK